MRDVLGQHREVVRDDFIVLVLDPVIRHRHRR
jgi:hypothetical protein